MTVNSNIRLIQINIFGRFDLYTTNSTYPILKYNLMHAIRMKTKLTGMAYSSTNISKQTASSHLMSLRIIEGHEIWRWKFRFLPGNAKIGGGLNRFIVSVFNVWIFISTCSVILIQTFILSLSLHSLCKTAAEVLVSLYKRHEEWEEWNLGG